MKKQGRKLFLPILLVALLLLVTGCGGGGNKPSPSPKPSPDPQEETDDRFYYVTFHAGKDGYFNDDKSQHDLKSLQLKGDALFEEAVPKAVNGDKVFVGWATTADAEEPDILLEITSTLDIGEDVYAVYTDEVYVEYNCAPGYYETDDGVKYPYVMASYQIGSNFREFVPQIDDDRYIFDGWYTGSFGTEERYTSENVIDRDGLRLIANWLVDGNMADPVYDDEEFRIDLGSRGAFFSFVPEESEVYTFYAHNYEPYDQTFPYIKLFDENMKLITDSSGEDEEGYIRCSKLLKAGTQYYVTLADAFGRDMSTDFGVYKPETVTVTFHANHEGAFFDNDPNMTVKQMKVGIGKELGHFGMTDPDLCIENPRILNFLGWTLEADEDWDPNMFPTATTDVDLYGQYIEFNTITLDGNGGIFRMLGGGTISYMNYTEGEVFLSDYEPLTMERKVKFGGWATTPDAKEPDIIEGYTLCEDLPETIYAVYTDRLLITFDANGGYFLQNPDYTVYRCSKGKGHIFDGMTVYTEDQLMKCVGWEDQHEEFIPYTVESYPDYHYQEDTVLKAVWAREIRVRGNGGYFADDETVRNIRVTRLAEDVFQADFGIPTSFDPDMEFAGWATDPNLLDPNVFEGETPMMELTEVYAIWRERE